MVSMVHCFLCRVSYTEKQQLEDHLTYQHGVVYNVDFITRVSQFRTDHSRLPVIDINKKNNNAKQCKKCKNANRDSSSVVKDANKSVNKEQMMRKLFSSRGKPATLEEFTARMSPSVTSEDDSLKKMKPENIKDKTNTYCNVCDHNFQTRILFLSHCSSVHDVKFKGKAGQPLVIPGNDKTQGNNVSDSDPPATPPSKKQKLSSNVDRTTPTTGKKKTEVPCRFCDKMFSSFSNKERHERQACQVSDDKSNNSNSTVNDSADG